MPQTKRPIRRVTISLREKDTSNLAFVAECTGLSENDSIRKALATERAFNDWIAEGCTIMVQDHNGGLRDVVFV